MPRPRSTAIVVLAACGTLLTGCVQQKAPGVAIRALNADIVFGVKPKDSEAPAPSNFSVTPDEASAASADTYDELPAQVFTPIARALPKPLQFDNQSKPAPVCDDAALNAFPDESAPLNVPDDRSPQVGLYKWKRSGTVTAADGTSQQLSGLEDRFIRNVVVDPADPTNAARRRYSWESLEPQVGANEIAVVTYHVDTAPTVNRQVLNPVGQDPPDVGEPERGVVLKSINYIDKNGNKGSSAGFNPTTGLLLLPLPVFDGQQFTSVAIDPATGQTWRYDAQVMGRDRVDACGTVLEGWRVRGVLDVSGTGAGTRTYSVVISPSLGGIVIGQSIQGTDGANQVEVSFNIGQKTPTPVEAEGQ